ncbi:MAG: site-2 protease family protein [Arcanobacterium sp.]|nr:site-2 protease family protein [Arcanobacterium sp.]
MGPSYCKYFDFSAWLIVAIFGILIFIFGLLASVAIHELGHLIPAKKFGVKVSQYFIGFGPTLWSTHRNGTEYGLKAIPLGGFVALNGMLAPARPGTRLQKADGTLTMAEQARRDSAAELAPGEEHRAFWRLSVPKKLAVMFGGPLTNLVLGIILFSIALVGIGLPTLSNQVKEVTQCLPNAVQTTAESTAESLVSSECDAAQESPAAKAGLLPGDVIISWGGVTTDSWEAVTAEISNSETKPIPVEILRGNEKLQLTVAPVLMERQIIIDGVVQVDANGEPILKEQPFVGISPKITREQTTLSEVPQQIWTTVAGTAKLIAVLPMKLWETATTLITGAERDPQGVVGLVGIADLAGSITASDVTEYSVWDRAGDFLLLLGSLNLTLFIFNMLPLLPLDGGHILGALIEGAQRKYAKLRGKPDPGAFDTARLLPFSNFVVAFFIFMTLLLVVADIVNPIF